MYRIKIKHEENKQEGEPKLILYYLNGQLHREDGPAVHYVDDGDCGKLWFLYDQEYDEDVWLKKVENV